MTATDCINAADIRSVSPLVEEGISEDETLTVEEWVQRHYEETCCHDPLEAERRQCGCRGENPIPSTASRLIHEYLRQEEAYHVEP